MTEEEKKIKQVFEESYEAWSDTEEIPTKGLAAP